MQLQVSARRRTDHHMPSMGRVIRLDRRAGFSRAFALSISIKETFLLDVLHERRKEGRLKSAVYRTSVTLILGVARQWLEDGEASGRR